VASHATVTAEHLAHYLEGLARQIGACPVDLVANGNTYEDVILESLRPTHTDRRWSRFAAEFIQQVTCPAECTTTTEAPAPATTRRVTTTSTTSTTDGPMTTEEPPTTTPAPESTTTTTEAPAECPDSAYCNSNCGDLTCSDFDGLTCGAFPCAGSLGWNNAGNCVWTPSGTAGACEPSDLICTGGYWTFTVTHNGAGTTCIYQKPATAESCPVGTYSKTGGTCSNCPDEVTVTSI
jgi:hypothetical protein